MFNNVYLWPRGLGLFGCPEKPLWPADYDNFNLSPWHLICLQPQNN